MKRYEPRVRCVALLLTLTAAAGCAGEKRAADPNDPNAPAVVAVPPVVLPSDTAKPDTMTLYRARMDSVKRALIPEYAILGLATVRGDRAMVAEFYAPECLVRIGDVTLMGMRQVVDGWVALARRGNVTEIERRPGTVVGVGDVYIDSGTFTIRSQEPNGKAKEERGDFVAEWQFTGDPARWMMRSDHLKSRALKP